MAKITYTNKVTLNPQPSIADENKVTSGDMNEIKSVVNGLIVNTYSESQENAYSCDYINSTFGGTIIDGVPYKTGKKYNNKDVYRLIKNLGYLPSGVLSDREISIGISGIYLISPAKISYQGVVSNVKRFYSSPFLGSTNINAWISDTGKIYVTTGTDRSNLQLVIDIEFIYNN